MFPCVCSLIDHRKRQNVVRTSVTHSPNGLRATFLFLPHFKVICDLLLNRHTVTWNRLVKYTLRETNKGPPILIYQKKPCHAGLLLPCFLRDMTTDFRRNGYSKNGLVCDCAGEPTHAITTLLSNSLLPLNILMATDIF